VCVQPFQGCKRAVIVARASNMGDWVASSSHFSNWIRLSSPSFQSFCKTSCILKLCSLKLLILHHRMHLCVHESDNEVLGVSGTVVTRESFCHHVVHKYDFLGKKLAMLRGRNGGGPDHSTIYCRKFPSPDHLVLH
jgi:hypothetical protein